MGGSGGGGYSGGGYGGGTTGGGGGSDGPPDSDQCVFNTGATLASPNSTVLPTLVVGQILDVALNSSGASAVVEIVAPAGTAGSLAGMPRLRELIACMAAGSAYEFEITAITGGRVDGRLRNK